MGAGDIIANTKPLVAGYSLEQFEAGMAYYLCLPDGGCGIDDVGALSGAVSKLGWDAESLVAHLDDAGSTGWCVVDLKSGAVRGPLSEAQMQAVRLSDKRLAAIQIRPASEVWRGL